MRDYDMTETPGSASWKQRLKGSLLDMILLDWFITTITNSKFKVYSMTSIINYVIPGIQNYLFTFLLLDLHGQICLYF